jgi:hypothetical protein
VLDCLPVRLVRQVGINLKQVQPRVPLVQLVLPKLNLGPQVAWIVYQGLMQMEGMKNVLVVPMVPWQLILLKVIVLSAQNLQKPIPKNRPVTVKLDMLPTIV